MYLDYFNLRELPFSITPDPRFLYSSQRHKEALAHMLYSVSNRSGFVLLTGEVGTGKTTICRTLLEQLPEQVDLALILNPQLTAAELVATICDDLSIPYPSATTSMKVLVDSLNSHLLQAHQDGRQVMVILDEAQSLRPEVLEQIRLLTNLETDQAKLLQIFLIGQPELQAMLARPDLRQLAQRITARYHITPLIAQETVEYVAHRLKVAGCVRPLFTPRALKLVHELTQGIPRLINKVCDRALLGTYSLGAGMVTPAIVSRAAAEVLDMPAKAPPRWQRPVGWLAAGLALAGAAVWLAHSLPWPVPPPVIAEVAVPPPAPPEPVAAPVAPEPPPAPLPVVEPPMVAAPPEPPPPPPPQPPSLMAILREHPASFGQAAAFAKLAGLWGKALPPGEDPPCKRAERTGLLCMNLTGNWNMLRLHDRPGILTLSAGAMERWHVVLSRLDQESATLATADQEITLPLSELDKWWFGEITMVWEPPFPTLPILREGMKQTEVIWLREQLLLALGETGPTPADAKLFDDQVTQLVKRFQTAHFLRPDGVVGPMTFFRLTTTQGATKGHPTLTPR